MAGSAWMNAELEATASGGRSDRHRSATLPRLVETLPAGLCFGLDRDHFHASSWHSQRDLHDWHGSRSGWQSSFAKLGEVPCLSSGRLAHVIRRVDAGLSLGIALPPVTRGCWTGLRGVGSRQFTAAVKVKTPQS